MKLVSISFAGFQSCHLLLGIALAVCFNQVYSTTNEMDRLALLAFKAGISGDPFGVLNSWNNSIGLCQWYGITCAKKHQRVMVLDLQSQDLSGSISPHIENLGFLREMLLQNNSFNQEIPPQLSRLHRLHVLQLDSNSLVGEIPINISACSNLVHLILPFNQLTGEIPTEVDSLLKLRIFSVYGNNLTGSVPSSIGNLSSLEQLYLTQNNLGWSIPQVLGHLTNLQYISCARNRLSGTIPFSLLNLSSLTVFDAGSNQIQGALPAGVLPPNLGNLQSLGKLQLSDNNLRGIIPSSLGNLTKPIELYLGGNNFQGQIPSHLSNCRSLDLLDLSNNNLSGAIPPQLIGLSSLAIILNLSGNHLTGVLPTEVGNLRALTALDISHNFLVGEIPSSLGECTQLTSLRMGGNFFHGSIPQSIRSLGGIEELDLSCNKFSGQIPEFLAVFRFLKLLNLSYNKFEGMLPCEGIFNNSTGTSIIGNNELYGGLPEFHLPNCISKSSKSRKINISILFAYVASGVLGIDLILALIYLRWLKKKTNESVSSLMDDSYPDISYGTLLKATDGFSSANLIGVGSLGSVFKGVLKDNGTAVAVKALHLFHHSAMKSFIVECEALKNIKHRNLLKILTICSSSDYQGNDFKAIVYEFMDNGSLEEWLHPNATSSHGNELPKKLNFIKRINIAIGVASALDYLHHQCHIPIIHCDLKPSNILLDAEMIAHVSDFGLAKFLLGSSLGEIPSWIGHFGYAPPEYAMGCEISREGDVYSYGILLLEMFTGLSPIGNTFRDNLTLHSFVIEALPE
ncbi:probable LRR receptor-like serine/threonine-protein kinase At3g47570 [Syzygium oleosum]|uniref:probable LRR receptor-like serine/threonine-protein kinase At3g47570 n=1 Tax=Syzygium oleosum TaxID=219896 RepID=UPI0024BBB215|nr:probable LRR receptor-like serine/threonine-protein kinase At3g47570 [Syzygium oleosum]